MYRLTPKKKKKKKLPSIDYYFNFFSFIYADSYRHRGENVCAGIVAGCVSAATGGNDVEEWERIVEEAVLDAEEKILSLRQIIATRDAEIVALKREKSTPSASAPQPVKDNGSKIRHDLVEARKEISALKAQITQLSASTYVMPLYYYFILHNSQDHKISQVPNIHVCEKHMFQSA